MRRLMGIRLLGHRKAETSDDSERGAVTLIVAFLLVVLLGFAALAIDVGALYAEKAQLQNGADAAALAIAGDCAAGACGTPTTTASRLANGNANDGSSGVSSITFPQTTTVRVETNSRDATTGSNSFSLFFARVLGISSADVRASAQASWGPPSTGTTLPWTMSECVFEKYLTPSQLAQLQSTGNFTGDPVPTHILMRYDSNAPTYPGCAAQNGYEPGGFGWLTTDSGCSTNISVSAQVNGQPGNHFPNAPACSTVLSTIMDKPVLVPLFNSATGNGSNATYTLVGFGAFQVTGYRFSGSGGVSDSLAPSCTGNCRGIQGFFARFVSLQEGMSIGGGLPNFGASVIALTG